MGSSILSWDISWSLSIPCQDHCIGYEFQIWFGISTISFGFYDNFGKVPRLWAGTVPENWAEIFASLKEKSIEVFYNDTKTWFKWEVEPSADPQAPANHQTSSPAALKPIGDPTSSGELSYPISLDNGLVSGVEPSGDPQQVYVS